MLIVLCLPLSLTGETQIEFSVDLVDVAQLCQSRQLIQALQIKVVEEFAGRGVHCRFARDIAVTDDAYPATLQQGFHDAGADRNTTNVFDVGAGDRLTIGNQRQSLQQGAGVARCALFPQARDPVGNLFACLEAVALAHLLQFDTTSFALLLQGVEHLQHFTLLRTFLFIEQLQQAIHVERFAGGKKRRLNNIFQILCIGKSHHSNPYSVSLPTALT